MSQTIWKFPLDVVPFQEIKMPSDVKILAIQIQGGYPHIWALVDPAASLEVRTFATYGTGDSISHDAGISLAYVGTYQFLGGTLVYHVFETDIVTIQ